MTTRSEQTAGGGLRAFFDDATFERLAMFQPVLFREDFLGAEAALATSAGTGPFIKKLVQTSGTPVAARVANAAGGVISLLVDATSEKQEATVYGADGLFLDASKALSLEIRAAFHTVPSAAAVQAVWGVQGAWADGPDNAGNYLRFQAKASGLVYAQAYDGTTTTSKSTGVTLSADAYSVFRIDATDPANVRFFIDGNEVANGVPFAATGSGAVLQPYLAVYKASGTGTGELRVDYVKAGAGRV